MSMDLDALRGAAATAARMAREHNAEKVTMTVTLAEGERYYISVDRVSRMVGRAPNRQRVLKQETVMVRENTDRGSVLYASPLEWLLDGPKVAA